jgi:acyl-coenzyme A synthetase/AMP-(fatty) acid ligase
MQQSSRASLKGALSHNLSPSNAYLWAADTGVAIGDLVQGTTLGGRVEELRDRSVVIATKDQLTTALALIELDGIASRLVLCPADLPPQDLAFVIDALGAVVIVSDGRKFLPDLPAARDMVRCSTKIVPDSHNHGEPRRTEWVLLTSGTTGRPKLVVHTLASLAGAIDSRSTSAGCVVWSTFYDIRRYGGLQIFLRAMLKKTSLVLSDPEESPADFLARASARGVTHISGTPSHWRRALMSSAVNMIAPQYVRLSGEIADQAILGRLKSVYPDARVSHAFASTEAGLAFEVNDGFAGFPANFIGRSGDVEMKIEEGSLRIRSNRTASCYLGSGSRALRDADGFVDTGDVLELRGDRYYFAGRRDGMINVGGLKVHPEEVEAVINRHPRVRMSLVRTRKNPITGSLVVADVVLGKESAAKIEPADDLQLQILQLCRSELPRHKVPAAINIVPALTVDASGKLARHA